MKKIRVNITELLRQILEGLQTTDNVEKRQWLLGAQSALMALDCDKDTMQAVMRDNECNLLVGKV